MTKATIFMTTKAENTKQNESVTFKCLVAGSGIKLTKRKLRIAFPKKKQEPITAILLTGKQNELVFSLPGAAVNVPALVTGPFACEIPWLMFKTVFDSGFEDPALIQFEFADGWFKIGSVLTRSKSIVLQSPNADVLQSTNDEVFSLAVELVAKSDAVEPELPVDSVTVVVDPADTPLGLPLLVVWSSIKKHGFQRLIVSSYAADQVDELLNKADKLLAPIGVSRGDIERLVDQKLGLNNPVPSEPS